MADPLIRPAHLGDMDRLLDWGHDFHKASPWSDVDYDPETAAATLADFIETPGKTVLICDDGAVGGITAPLMFNHRAKVAYEAFWYAGRHGRALRLAFERWARAEGASHIAMACLENSKKPALTRLYARAGYHPTEQFFIKEIHPWQVSQQS